MTVNRYWKGKKFSEAHKEKIRIGNLGKKGNGKGRKKGYKHSEETKEKIRIGNLGKCGGKGRKKGSKGQIGFFHHCEETRLKMRKAKLGKKRGPMPEEWKRKIGKANSGSNSHLWKGGITPENERIRHSIEYRLWREAVFARDNWTCQNCGARSGNGKAVFLHAHHINSFSKFPELRTSIENGIILCKKCHKIIHKPDKY